MTHLFQQQMAVTTWTHPWNLEASKDEVKHWIVEYSSLGFHISLTKNLEKWLKSDQNKWSRTVTVNGDSDVSDIVMLATWR